jgi:NAD/NADP transhydrogenase beta subunit
MLQAYKPSNRVPLIGLVLLILTTIIGGGMLGELVYLIGEHLYLVIIFPLAMGLLGGVLINIAAHVGKVRNPALTMVFGVLIGLAIYGTYRYAEYYQGFRSDVRDEVKSYLGNQYDENDLQDYIDLVLEDETGSTGFVGYVKLSADEGISITSSRASTTNSGAMFRGTGSYVYWGIELLVILFVARYVASITAKQPFCETTNEWYKSEEYVGTIPPNDVPVVVSLLEAGRGDAAGSMLVALNDAPMPRYDLVTQRSSRPDVDVILRVQKLTQGNKGTITRDNLHTWTAPVYLLQQIQNCVQTADKLKQG